MLNSGVPTYRSTSIKQLIKQRKNQKTFLGGKIDNEVIKIKSFVDSAYPNEMKPTSETNESRFENKDNSYQVILTNSNQIPNRVRSRNNMP